MKGFIDIHSHILPYLDDGSQSLEQAIDILEQAYNEGIGTIIATPHFYEGIFDNTKLKIEEALLLLEQVMNEKNIEIDIKIGCEVYYSHDICKFLNEGLIPTMNGTRYILVEFAPMEAYRNIKNGLMHLIYNGYQPILAHGERYDDLIMDLDKVRELIKMGVRIQVNADSVIGKFGRRYYKVTKRLIKYNLVHYIASDTHNSSTRRPSLKKAYSMIAKKYGNNYARSLFIDNPSELIINELVMQKI